MFNHLNKDNYVIFKNIRQLNRIKLEYSLFILKGGEPLRFKRFGG